MMATNYMHLLNGKPAAFSEDYGGYIYYAGARHPATLRTSLKQIRREQAVAISNPQNMGMSHNYNYVLVRLP